MQTFQILYLRHNKLEHSETLFGLDLLQAIERASQRVPDLSAEIWSEQGRVGIVEPLPDRTEVPRQGPGIADRRFNEVSASTDALNYQSEPLHLARFALLGGDMKLRPDTRLVDERVIQTCKLEVDFGNLLTIGR